jgi:hypothetical protein
MRTPPVSEVLSRDRLRVPGRECRQSSRIVSFPFSFLNPLNKFHEKPACDKEHNGDADKQDVHEPPSLAWITIITTGIKLLLRMGAKV